MKHKLYNSDNHIHTCMYIWYWLVIQSQELLLLRCKWPRIVSLRILARSSVPQYRNKSSTHSFENYLRLNFCNKYTICTNLENECNNCKCCCEIHSLYLECKEWILKNCIKACSEDVQRHQMIEAVQIHLWERQSIKEHSLEMQICMPTL